MRDEELALIIEALADGLIIIEGHLDKNPDNSLRLDYEVTEETLGQVKAVQSGPRHVPTRLKFPEGFDN